MEDLPDSTDWIKTSLPLFEPLEAALRCEVCKEFYENPVITTCSHTFCSLCIRRCISSDGKCPACKTSCQADRLLLNNAVREIVNRFQEARPKALELARLQENQDDAPAAGTKGKRKLDDTDIEDSEPRRSTRSRIARSQISRADGMVDAPIEVADSEDDGDEYVPEGSVRCPMCNAPMKEEQVWSHVNVCTGEKKPAGGRSTRSRANNKPLKTLQHRPKEESPPPSRLPGLNYALLKEAALKKKLQDIGIPAWGKKELLIRRHTEWLHLWNSNCDASESRRKSKRELLKELDTWERTQGGHANTTESKIMRKDFDGQGYASTHRNEFDALIANARKKREKAKEEGKTEEIPNDERRNEAMQLDGREQPAANPEPPAGSQHNVDPSRPYNGNESALENVRKKVEDTDRNGTIEAARNAEDPTTTMGIHDSHMTTSRRSLGLQDPFGSPSRKLPMFSLPEQPVVDVEDATSVQ